MAGSTPVKSNERRQKKDWVTRAVPFCSVIGWACALTVLAFLERAKPEDPDFFSRIRNTVLRTTWNESLVRISFFILLAIFLFCALGFIFNMLRNRRKTDKINHSLLVLGILSVGGLGLFLWQFHSFL